MFDTRTKARSLAFLFSAAALICVLTVLLPHVAAVEERYVLALGALAAALALAFLRLADQLSGAIVHPALAAVTVILTGLIHYTHNTTLYALVYMWPALYAFYFFSTRAALAHLALIGIAYAAVLRIDGTMDATIRLVLVLGTPLVVGLLISRLLGGMRAAIERSARQERALRSSERRTRLIVDSARDGFISTDAQGRVLDINAAAERLLGRSRADALGRPFQELGIPREAHAKFIQRRRDLLKAAREGGTRHLELRVTINRPDGTQLRGETMIWVVERDGELTFNARLTDIGERLREERKRERLVRAEAARAEAERAALTIGRLQAVADVALTRRDLDELKATALARAREVLEAEAAALLLVEKDGSLSLVTSDSAGTEDRPERVAPDAGIAGRVLATRRPVLVHDPSAADLADPAILGAGISSLLGVPLVAREEVIGVLEVGVRAPRRLGPEDVDLLRLTADRVALAIEHVEAYRREHRIAETLQRSLLPEKHTLPALPGVALAWRYVPAASEAEVGGDWYDAIGLTGGRVLLVMGDVSGKGLAAASTLGALRSAIRAYALEGNGPAEIADRLNRFVLSEPIREHMATLVLAVFDPVDAELCYVNAGHPPPLTLTAGGEARFLDGARSVPLGVLPFPSYRAETVTLEPGGALVLYTDGLVERRAEHLDLGFERLAAAAADGPLEAQALCDRLLATALPAGATSDDVALLVLCHVPLGSRLALDLPSEPSALGSLRALLRRWLAQAEASDVDIHAIVMACSEACTNAIQHAGAATHEPIAFEALLREGEVEVTVRDGGRWRDESPPSDQGRGLELIDALMDDVELEMTPSGTSVRLRRRLTARVSA
ncbi:MAG TPA: SpoIIE family protein phosphatase [Solirubrobacteraceae bacterium]|nr:SpoIIE family protein phosphatase [Solirubrobacteraceae bacterium]